MSAPFLLVASDIAIALAAGAIALICAQLLFRNRQVVPFSASLIPLIALVIVFGVAFLADAVSSVTPASPAVAALRALVAAAAVAAAAVARHLGSGVIGIVDAAKGAEQRRADLERRRAELEEAARIARHFGPPRGG
jgi:hypothetical protein